MYLCDFVNNAANGDPDEAYLGLQSTQAAHDLSLQAS